MGPFGLYVWCPSKSQGRKIPKRPPEKAPTMPPNSARLVGVLLLGRIELPASDWDEGRCENRWACPPYLNDLKPLWNSLFGSSDDLLHE